MGHFLLRLLLGVVTCKASVKWLIVWGEGGGGGEGWFVGRNILSVADL